jgi:hypothetical protein
MVEHKTNSSSVYLLISFMIVFFSFIHSEREKSIPGSEISSITISSGKSHDIQANIAPETQTPAVSFYRFHAVNGKDKFIGFITNSGNIVDQQLFTHLWSSEPNVLFKDPVIGLTFRQKIPGREKNDDPLPIS